jgi:nucleoside-diphosphate-sugar epimerase
LINEGYQIIAITKNKNKVYYESGISWKFCDLSIQENDFTFLREADILIHAAAVSYAYTYKEYIQNNFKSTVNLVNAAKVYNVKNFIYISSVSAGLGNGYYGISKIKSEDYIKANLSKWLIIRPAQIYGYVNKTAIDKLISNIKNNRIVLCPVGDKKIICPIYYKDLAQKLLESIIYYEDSNTTIVMHGPEKFTYLELVKNIKNNLKRDILILYIPKFFIFLAYFFIKAIKIKVGIYPDQFFRFYNNPEFNFTQNENITISKYLSLYLK